MKRWILLIVWMAAAAIGEKRLKCNRGWTLFEETNTCYKRYKEGRRSFNSARGFCERKGFLLAEPLSDDESVFLSDLVGHGDAWIGIEKKANGVNIYSSTKKEAYLKPGRSTDSKRCYMIVGTDSYSHKDVDYEKCDNQLKNYFCMERGPPGIAPKITVLVTTTATRTPPRPTVIAPDNSMCEAGWEYYNVTNMCHRFFEEGPRNFQSARDFCRSKSAILAESRSVKELKFLNDLAGGGFNNPNSPWIGFVLENGVTYHSSSREVSVWKFTRNHSGTKCDTLMFSGTGQYEGNATLVPQAMSKDCNRKIKGYLCMKPGGEPFPQFPMIPESSKCDPGWSFYVASNKCYKHFMDQTRDFESAKQSCINKKAILAEPASGEEVRFLHLLAGHGPVRNNDPWIGLVFRNGTHRYESSDEIVAYTNRNIMMVDQHCGRIPVERFSEFGTQKTTLYHCKSKSTRYICMKPGPAPETTTSSTPKTTTVTTTTKTTTTATTTKPTTTKTSTTPTTTKPTTTKTTTTPTTTKPTTTKTSTTPTTTKPTTTKTTTTPTTTKPTTTKTTTTPTTTKPTTPKTTKTTTQPRTTASKLDNFVDCDKGWKRKHNSDACYKVFHGRAKTEKEARIECAKKNADPTAALAVNPGEELFVIKLAGKGDDPWIGKRELTAVKVTLKRKNHLTQFKRKQKTTECLKLVTSSEMKFENGSRILTLGDNCLATSTRFVCMRIVGDKTTQPTIPATSTSSKTPSTQKSTTTKASRPTSKPTRTTKHATKTTSTPFTTSTTAPSPATTTCVKYLVQCKKGWVNVVGTDRCYKVFHGVPRTDHEARIQCTNVHKEKMEVFDGDEEFLITLAGNGSDPWIGRYSEKFKRPPINSTNCSTLITSSKIKKVKGVPLYERGLRCSDKTTRFICSSVAKEECVSSSNTATPPSMASTSQKPQDITSGETTSVPDPSVTTISSTKQTKTSPRPTKSTTVKTTTKVRTTTTKSTTTGPYSNKNCSSYTCEEGWALTGDRCYKVFDTAPINGWQATLLCNKNVAFLLHYDEDLGFLKSLAGDGVDPWIGDFADRKKRRTFSFYHVITQAEERPTGCARLNTNEGRKIATVKKYGMDCDTATTRTICGKHVTKNTFTLQGAWKSFKNNVYKYVNGPKVTMADAEKRCVEEGAHLVSFEDKEEAKFAFEMAKEKSTAVAKTDEDQPWTGVIMTTKSRVWTDKTKGGHMKWTLGEPPKKLSGEICGKLAVDATKTTKKPKLGQLIATRCEVKSRSYICKKRCHN